LRARDTVFSGFLSRVSAKPVETLEDLNRGLSDHVGRFAEIPKPKRMAIAHGFLANMGLCLDDFTASGG
jgi:hypothetical protein